MSKEKQIEEMALDICKSRLVAEDGDACRKCRQHNNCLYQEIAYGLYNAGYRKQEWISVDERLPEASGAYIVCRFDGYVYKTFFSGTFPKAITHWMPLPEPPMMKGGAE